MNENYQLQKRSADSSPPHEFAVVPVATSHVLGVPVAHVATRATDAVDE